MYLVLLDSLLEVLREPVCMVKRRLSTYVVFEQGGKLRLQVSQGLGKMLRVKANHEQQGIDACDMPETWCRS